MGQVVGHFTLTSLQLTNVYVFIYKTFYFKKYLGYLISYSSINSCNKII